MLERLLSTFDTASPLELIMTAVDVALVAFVIYRVLLLIKGTKAVQMLAGLMLVAVFYFVSKDTYLGLRTLNWLLDRFMASFIIILVILFQDDIRRGLTQVGGRTSPIATNTSEAQANAVEAVVKAAELLKKHQMGALIVMERTAGVEGHLDKPGIPINADVSEALLFALFNKEHANPTHDGAVLIREGRIAQAKCILPLTTDPAVEQVLGTRHRAALGISELVDAAVVVVSEETGAISVVFGGEFRQRGADITALRAELQKLFNAKSRPRRIRSVIRARIQGRSTDHHAET